MSIKLGDKIISEDHCAIGILTNIDGKLYVVGKNVLIEYDIYSSDWKLYSLVKTKNIMTWYKRMFGGLIYIAQGIVTILTFGTIRISWTYKYTKWLLFKSI